MKYLFSLIFVLFILLAGDYNTQYQICCFQGIILAVESKGGRGGGRGRGRGGHGGGRGSKIFRIPLYFLVGILLLLLVLFLLYFYCTGEEEEEEEVVAPEENVVEQGGVVN